MASRTSRARRGVGGPCVVFAPLIVVVFIVALPFWPVAIVLAALTWCVARVADMFLDGEGGRPRSTTAAYWLVLVCKPWLYFDPPDERAARRARLGRRESAE